MASLLSNDLVAMEHLRVSFLLHDSLVQDNTAKSKLGIRALILFNESLSGRRQTPHPQNFSLLARASSKNDIE